MLLDLTFDPSFKVIRWFTGFGELSFRWIQISIVCSLMRRSSYIIATPFPVTWLVIMSYFANHFLVHDLPNDTKKEGA